MRPRKRCGTRAGKLGEGAETLRAKRPESAGAPGNVAGVPAETCRVFAQHCEGSAGVFGVVRAGGRRFGRGIVRRRILPGGGHLIEEEILHLATTGKLRFHARGDLRVHTKIETEAVDLSLR